MGWSTLARGGIVATLGLGIAPLACGGIDRASATESSSGADSGGAATAGHSAAAAGPGSSGAATAGGSASAAAGGGGTAGAPGAGVSQNVYVDELRPGAGCLPRALPVVLTTDEAFEAGQVPCSLSLLSVRDADGACVCDASQKLTQSAGALANALATKAAQSGYCGGASGIDCQSLCACDLAQASGALLEQCETDSRTPLAEMPPGFCYMDITVRPSLQTAAIIGSCPVDSQQVLRIMGPTPSEPAPRMYLACAGSPI